MKLEQSLWTTREHKSASDILAPSVNHAASLVFLFGQHNLVTDKSNLASIQARYPKAFLFGCSTAGEIHGNQVHDATISITAMEFSSTTIRHASILLSDTANCFEAGITLAKAIPHQDLRHVFVLSVGLNVNGSDLAKGLSTELPSQVSITGGLAGDEAKFQKTAIIAGDLVSDQAIAIVGLYGKHLQIGTASLGGWDTFGVDRLVTKSKENVLYELDGKSALDLYKMYLGDQAKSLPASALLFPLCLRTDQSQNGIVRTILAVNEKDQSMTFAGDIPEGSYGRFMKANFDRLIEGAIGAAKLSVQPIKNSKPQFALLISCVGRKLVLGQRTEEEVEGVREILGPNTIMTGFYSYGEISPFTPSAKCELHNQTMTITTLSEDDESYS